MELKSSAHGPAALGAENVPLILVIGILKNLKMMPTNQL